MTTSTLIRQAALLRQLVSEYEQQHVRDAVPLRDYVFDLRSLVSERALIEALVAREFLLWHEGGLGVVLSDRGFNSVCSC
ncbi:MAG: hypothetical protein VW877_10700 [Pseudomonadaceae bacterium]